MKDQIKASITIFVSLAALAFFAVDFAFKKDTVGLEGYSTTEFSSWTPEEATRGLANADEKPTTEQLYAAAREHSANGRFDDCLSKLQALHQDVTEYKDSRELKSFCTQAKFQKRQRIAERKARKTASK